MAKGRSRLKEEILDLLERDKEFRYAVAGYLGISETLKRLDALEERMVQLLEEQKKLWEEVKGLREGQEKLWEDVKGLKEGQDKLWEEVKGLRESQEKLWEEVKGLKESVKGLREGQEKLWEEVSALRKGQEKLWKEVKRIRVTTDRLALSLEEEARSFIAHRLKQELGIDVKLDRVFVDSEEIDIYGAAGDICIIGEATVRLGPKRVQRLIRRIELIKQRRPDLLRRKVIKAIYTYVAVPEALEVAVNNKVWVLDWQRNLTPIAIEEAG
jgi:chromosome segregation ATPase